jgi:hypothetical protein
VEGRFREERNSLTISTRSAFLVFLNMPRVYDPNELRRETQEPTPEDLVAWIEHHPWLEASKPRPAFVGGVEGRQIDVTAARLPKDHPWFVPVPASFFSPGTARVLHSG